MLDLSADEVRNLYRVVKPLVAEMARLGGRDSEKDLFGRPGGYRTILGAKTAGAPCPACGSTIQKETYLGGSICACPACQPLL